MILAGVLLKLGAYGFLRLVLPLYPAESAQFAPVLALLATAAIIFGALSAYGQTDFKRLVAYSSVNHMGFVVLGIAAAAYAAGTESATIALNGAVLQMFNHGISAAAMFFLVGVIYERTHTRDLGAWGGLFPLVPVFGGLLIFSSMSSLGLPGLNGFVSEFLVVRGAWPIFTLFTALSMIGLLFTGAYILKGIASTLHGPLNEKWKGQLTDISRREILVLAPLLVFMLWLGLWPAWLLSVINQAVVGLFG
jgi:NADH-quinone oxidoreductase subunit M